MWDGLTPTLPILTFLTGILDAVSFIALGQVFVAMQTGNVSFLGIGIGPRSPTPAPRRVSRRGRGAAGRRRLGRAHPEIRAGGAGPATPGSEARNGRQRRAIAAAQWRNCTVRHCGGLEFAAATP
jgi:hypothetical protein